MPIKDLRQSQSQSRLFGYKLSEELNCKNKLYKLREVINWENLEDYVLSIREVRRCGQKKRLNYDDY